MNFKKFVAVLSILSVACIPAFAQNDTVGVKSIVDKTIKYNADFPLEKVYVHFDKPYYAAGDTIWFKAYLTSDMLATEDMTKNRHLPSQISKIVYVDILTAKDSLVQSLKLPVSDGVAAGDILLYKNIYKQGNYHIRAYTNWMRNFDAEYFFNKTIPIGTLVDRTVFSTITMAGQFKDDKIKVDAVIHYYTADGRDYAGRKVSWKVQNSEFEDNLGKGKGTTDSKGNLTVSFNTSKSAALSTAMLITGIEINNNTTINSYPLKNVASPIDVQFFPEGGDMVSGVKSKIAFKAVKADGLGADFKGTITDNSNAVVANIAPQHLGMGFFELTPASGKTYKANLTFADGSVNSYELPGLKDAGMTLSLNNTDPEKITLTFAANDAFIAAGKSKTIAIIAKSGQLVCYAGQVPLVSKLYTATIPKSKFPSGVAQFTIFASNGEVLAERLAFIQRKDQLQLTLTTPKTTYTGRDLVPFTVGAKTPANQPALANLSVAVIDDKKVPFDENSETTILTHQLLTADLKGYVEKPNYYFNAPSAQTAANLDILMLTQGYRRYAYKEILANKPPVVKYLPEESLEVNGSLRTGTGMAVSRGTINFYIKNMKISSVVSTDQNGDFRIPKLFFPDSVKAVVNARGSANANNLMIILNNPQPQAVTPSFTNGAELTNIDTALNAYLQNDKKLAQNSRVIQEVVIKDTKVEKKASHQDYPNLVGLSMMADHTLDGSALKGCPNVFTCIRSMMPGVIENQNVLYLAREYNSGRRTPMSIYMDGAVIDYTDLLTVLPDNIDQVEVFNTEGLSGINRVNNTSGVLVVTSKKRVKAKLDKELLAELLSPQYSARNFTPKGYYMARSFYSPKYDAAKTGSFGGDLRTTIYWNPKIITDKTTGAATFDVTNADGTGTYRAIIEGIDADGNIGRTVYRYTVK
ncbi:MAG: carboxypeptidase regulatory-like domain-containing protein [Bacteroidota bacterium]